MKYFRFIIALLVLTAALALQFFCASFGWSVNFALAALIVFALFFDLGEIIILLLFSIFVINWEPAFTWDLLLLGLIPLGAFVFRKIFPWNRWAAGPALIIAGLLVLYIALAPTAFIANFVFFLEDLGGALAFGALVLGVMDLLRFP